MTRLILIILLFLLSLLNMFRAPVNILWYVSILTTEFCWLFFVATCVVLAVKIGPDRYMPITVALGILSLVFYAFPAVKAMQISLTLDARIDSAFGIMRDSSDFDKPAFRPSKMITGLFGKQITPRTFRYRGDLTLDFYKAVGDGPRPCIVVIHGGSWAGGNSAQLPELNSLLALEGYHVASINYRLAPRHWFPAPVMDVKDALRYLQKNGDELNIDTNKMVLLGRSAGAQVALTAAYTLNERCIKGVISYYGPTDMVWGYLNPANPLVMDSKKIMENYLGGTYAELPHQYVNSSATQTATEGSVPSLLIQGRNDPLVAWQHSTKLQDRLVRCGVKHFLLALPWATHGCDYTLNGPGGQLSTHAVRRFLKIALEEKNIQLKLEAAAAGN